MRMRMRMQMLGQVLHLLEAGGTLAAQNMRREQGQRGRLGGTGRDRATAAALPRLQVEANDAHPKSGIKGYSSREIRNQIEFEIELRAPFVADGSRATERNRNLAAMLPQFPQTFLKRFPTHPKHVLSKRGLELGVEWGLDSEPDQRPDRARPGQARWHSC